MANYESVGLFDKPADKPVSAASAEVALGKGGYGAKHHPLLANVVRAFLGAPATAAVLERDFGEAGKLVNRQLSSLDLSFVERIMFVRGAYDLIPEDVPVTPPAGRAEAIAVRLKDLRKKQLVRTSFHSRVVTTHLTVFHPRGTADCATIVI